MKNMLFLGATFLLCTGCEMMKETVTSSIDHIKSQYQEGLDEICLERIQKYAVHNQKNLAYRELQLIRAPLPRSEALLTIAGIEERLDGKASKAVLTEIQSVLAQIPDRDKTRSFRIEYAEYLYLRKPDEALKLVDEVLAEVKCIPIARERVPFMIDLVRFHLRASQDIDAAKKLITSTENINNYISFPDLRRKYENRLAEVLELYSHVLCD